MPDLVIPKPVCWCCQKETEESDIVLPIMLCLNCFATLRIVIQKEKARLALNLKYPDTEKETRTLINAYKNRKESELSINFKVINKQEGPFIRKDTEQEK